MCTIGILSLDQTMATNLYKEIILTSIKNGAIKDQDHIPTISISFPNQNHYSLELIKLVVELGADCIVIPSLLTADDYLLFKDYSNITILCLQQGQDLSKFSEVIHSYTILNSKKKNLTFYPRPHIPAAQISNFINHIKTKHGLIIGALCGAGPLAGAVYCEELAAREVPFIMISDTQAPGKNNHIMNQGDDFRYNYLNDLLLLDQFVDAHTIACNTAHVYKDLFASKLSKPILDIRKGSVRKFQQHYNDQKLILLGTPATVYKTKIYQQILVDHDIQIIEPSLQQLDVILEAIYEVKENRAEPKNKILQIIKEIRDQYSNDDLPVLLACTELNVPFNSQELLELKLIDTSAALADYSREFSTKNIMIKPTKLNNHNQEILEIILTRYDILRLDNKENILDFKIVPKFRDLTSIIKHQQDHEMIDQIINEIGLMNIKNIDILLTNNQK